VVQLVQKCGFIVLKPAAILSHPEDEAYVQISGEQKGGINGLTLQAAPG